MTAIDWTYVVILGAMTAAVLYLYLLAAFGLAGTGKYPELSGPCDFLILVPAHNEESVIAETLSSLLQLERAGRVEVVVIADNCTDQTAQIARDRGVTVMERSNLREIGKGYALEWAMAQHDLNEFTAVAVVDADTIVEPNMLLVMARALESGAGAVQLQYEFAPLEESPLARLQYMASVVENTLFYRGRSALRLPILLRGTGMAIASDILKKNPWDSHSLTEDVDYAVKIMRLGVRIVFSSASKVTSAAVSTYQQSLAQKKRWASGTFNLIADHFFPLMGDALTKGRLDLMELGFSLLLLSRPTLILANLILVPIAFLGSPEYRLWFVLWPLALVSLLIIYLCLGVFLVKDKGKAAKALVYVPFFGIWLVGVQILAFVERRRLSWTRTDRDSS